MGSLPCREFPPLGVFHCDAVRGWLKECDCLILDLNPPHEDVGQSERHELSVTICILDKLMITDSYPLQL